MNFWYDQLARDRARRFGPKVAFETYRNLLEGSGVDPYREPMFDRVWARVDGRGTTFGLQFGGQDVEAWLGHVGADYAAGRGMALEEAADRLLGRVEAAGDPWHDFVAFAERFKRDLDTGDGFELMDWQRRFAEAVESGSVPVSFANAGGPEGKQWQADVLAAFHEARGTPEGGEPPSLAGLQRTIGSVQSADSKPVDYMVLDPAVPPGNHIDGRDGLGKRYVRVPAGALDEVGPPKRPPAGTDITLWGIKVYRREDLPKSWPDPLPLPVSSSP